MPSILIHLKCSKEAALHRIKHQDAHHEGELDRRYAEYEHNHPKLLQLYQSLNHSHKVKILEIETAQKSEEEVLKLARDLVFQEYRFLDFLHVSEDNERALIDKLQKQEETKATRSQQQTTSKIQKQ